jgi:hypothetical protein
MASFASARERSARFGNTKFVNPADLRQHLGSQKVMYASYPGDLVGHRVFIILGDGKLFETLGWTHGTMVSTSATQRPRRIIASLEVGPQGKKISLRTSG